MIRLHELADAIRSAVPGGAFVEEWQTAAGLSALSVPADQVAARLFGGRAIAPLMGILLIDLGGTERCHVNWTGRPPESLDAVGYISPDEAFRLAVAYLAGKLPTLKEPS